MIDKIKEYVYSYYWNDDIYCARTSLLTLCKLFDYDVSPQTVAAAIGLHGAGGYRAQCGLVEGPLMFIGIYYDYIGKSENEIAKICYDFADKFHKKFSSLSCFDLRPNGFSEFDELHLCENLTVEAINFAYEYLNVIY